MARNSNAAFVQVLQVARENQLSRFGTVSLDGTKIHANASRHSALSYGHAEKIEAQLKAEVQELLALAEAADQSAVPDGVKPARRDQAPGGPPGGDCGGQSQDRGAGQRTLRAGAGRVRSQDGPRAAKEAATGKKPGGKPPKPPESGPRADDQINLTDEESRIMKVAGGGFEQCYNAQAVVDTESMLILAPHVTQATNDKEQVEPMVAKIAGAIPKG